MSQTSEVKTGLTVCGLMTRSVTMSTWLLVSVFSVLLLAWYITIVVVSVVL